MDLVLVFIVVEVQLKSDYFRIEILMGNGIAYEIGMLKSDYFRIEIREGEYGL